MKSSGLGEKAWPTKPMTLTSRYLNLATFLRLPHVILSLPLYCDFPHVHRSLSTTSTRMCWSWLVRNNSFLSHAATKQCDIAEQSIISNVHVGCMHISDLSNVHCMHISDAYLPQTEPWGKKTTHLKERLSPSCCRFALFTRKSKHLSWPFKMVTTMFYWCSIFTRARTTVTCSMVGMKSWSGWRSTSPDPQRR